MALGIGISLSIIVATIGLLLILTTAFLPVDDLIVAGIALTASGITAHLIPFIGKNDVISMSVLTLLFGVVMYYYWNENVKTVGSKGETSSSSSLRGKTGVVTDTIPENGTGKVDIKGSGGFGGFSAKSYDNEEIEQGTEIMVVEPGGGSVLQVARDDMDSIDRELRKEREKETELE